MNSRSTEYIFSCSRLFEAVPGPGPISRDPAARFDRAFGTRRVMRHSAASRLLRLTFERFEARLRFLPAHGPDGQDICQGLRPHAQPALFMLHDQDILA